MIFSVCVPCVDGRDCYHMTGLCRNSKCVTCWDKNECYNSASSICTGHFGVCPLYITKTCSTSDDCPNMGLARCEAENCISCIQDADCSHFSGNNFFCDNGLCKNCLSDEDCSGSQVCSPGSGLCVGCTSNFDCLDLEKSMCSLATGECQECQSDADCVHLFTLGKGHCNTDLAPNKCFECEDDTDCLSGTCDANKRCQSICTDSSSCTSLYNPRCDASKCQPCNSKNDCTKFYESAGACDTETSPARCIECVGHNDCPVTKPICRIGVCGPCEKTSECVAKGLNFCLTETGKCLSINISCTDDSQCTFINLSNCLIALGTCSPCTDNDDCLRISQNSIALNTCLTDSDAADNKCAQCNNNNYCTGSQFINTRYCNLDGGWCVECIEDSNCISANADHKCLKNKCRECIYDSDCGIDKPYCSGEICIQCKSSLDCNGASCNINGICESCLDTPECQEKTYTNYCAKENKYCDTSSSLKICKLLF